MREGLSGRVDLAVGVLQPDALLAFAHAQKRLLVQTYDGAWQSGVGNYTPPPDQQPDDHTGTVVAGVAGAVALALAKKYAAPTHADQTRRAVALAPAFKGVDRMTAELATLVPSLENQQATAEAAAAGTIDPQMQAAYAYQQALNDWIDSNAYRLTLGDSVAWAGEQAGYGEAADAGGELLDWDDTGDSSECDDCAMLATMGPMPLDQWPTTPGSGATECSVGCRCSMSSEGPSYGFQGFSLSDDQQATADKVVDAQSEALNGLMPDMSLLS